MSLQDVAPPYSPANQQVLTYIEATFNQIIQDIQSDECQKVAIVLRRITSITPYHDHEDSMRLKWHIQDTEVVYNFPGKNKDEAWRFACLARILSEIHTAINQGVVVTKRDIFYHDPALFKQQATVDRYVDDIAHTCGVTRRDLNVTASPKGLVAGLRPSNAPDEIAIIHDGCDLIASDDLETINWVLVIEKEAKGYPDLTTRRFLRALVDHCQPHAKVFGLFDNDPDGIRILKCYLYGSKAMAQEQACILPELEWIGLKSEDLVTIPEAENLCLPMSTRDRTVAVSMLNSEEWRDEDGRSLPMLSGCHLELQRMLWLNRKAEIQIVDEMVGGLYGWLTRTLSVRLEDVQIRPEYVESF
ncbi:hypothetical protein LTR84_012279 [Exophiala bonariae]|uniref:DNA topoisomerase (ATP-hydrolyzing) n=1 Tax=Exophiala bonariae TaxID=1690606 RepID=A0AAV9NFR4_9EURO|nr:hypothetical protein LTR84_012279 [Exophiala bonariae]